MDRPDLGDALLAVLDDAAAGAAARIEWAAVLARALGRSLALVHVENPLALHAAALPQTQALAHAGAEWQPLDAEDVERGWRAQAARMRTLAIGIAKRHPVSWTLRTVRARWPGVALELSAQADLLLVGSAPRRAVTSAVLLLDGADGAATRALPLARELAQVLAAPLQVLAWHAGDEAALRAQAARTVVCLLPRERATPSWLLDPPCPLLLVG